MKTINSILFIIFFSICSYGQPNRDKIKTLKIAFITEKLNLGEKEAQQFWPIYNNFEEESSKLKKEAFEKRKNINFDAISEDEAKHLLRDIRLMENKKQSLENDYMDNLSKVLSAKKIILLHKIEDDFKRKMFEEYKRRRPN